ncbi:MAG: hypothetical protein HOH36_00565 [Acidimicrobiaceae bacterium]|nr:hypothetical protein [Acidimicrobiaceae bacterium]
MSTSGEAATLLPDNFAQTLADEMTRITTGRYRTQRRGGHIMDRNESSTDRAYWPGVEFAPTTAGLRLLTTFTLNNDDRVFGFRVDLPSAVERWNLRIGIVDAASRPALFAAELCWYLVIQIGAADLDDVEPDHDGIGWINTATEVFGRLKVSAAN